MLSDGPVLEEAHHVEAEPAGAVSRDGLQAGALAEVLRAQVGPLLLDAEQRHAERARHVGQRVAAAVALRVAARGRVPQAGPRPDQLDEPHRVVALPLHRLWGVRAGLAAHRRPEGLGFFRLWK